MSERRKEDLSVYFNPNENGNPSIRQGNADALLLIACHRGDYNKVKETVEEYGADINAGRPRALFYALNSCSPVNQDGEKIIRYLVNKGAEVDFRHGPVSLPDVCKPYFVFFVANNDYASDDIVYFVASKSSKEALSNVPRTRFDDKSALAIIKEKRPSVYKMLVENGLVESNKR